MANEGFLGKHSIGGERAATGDHQVVLHYLPLSEGAKAKAIPVGTVLKRVDGEDGAAVWEPLLSSDEARSCRRRLWTAPAIPRATPPKPRPCAWCMAG